MPQSCERGPTPTLCECQSCDILVSDGLYTLGDVDGVDAQRLVHGCLFAQAGAEVNERQLAVRCEEYIVMVPISAAEGCDMSAARPNVRSKKKAHEPCLEMLSAHRSIHLHIEDGSGDDDANGTVEQPDVR